MSQADAAPITGEPVLTGGKSTAVTVSRRAAIGALAVLPVATVAAPSTSSPAALWRDALRAYHSAEADYLGHLNNVWNPLMVRLEQLCPMPPMHEIVERNGRPLKVVYKSAEPDSWMRLPSVEAREVGRKLAAQWSTWSEGYGARQAEYNFWEIEQEDLRLYDLYQEAQDRLMRMPAPDAAALLTKLEIIWADEYQDRQIENERLIRRDLQRLAA
ncbi:hypothetical protein [Sphingobium olei]|uniref:Uncharacterized protein n=1 Tax=Sphingobium olei TaxID=420955 RepID=A0ABW3P4I7_9SPHN